MAKIPITVLMPVYNAKIYLAKSIETILEQTYEDFEFLIIDDGSTDNSLEILHSYRDSRIKLIRQDNLGVAAALRLGVELAKGEYLARMDADDESLPDRLEIQKRVLDQNPQACLVHGMHNLIDKNGTIIMKDCGKGWTEGKGKWLLLWANIIIHPTVMLRTRVLREHRLNYRLETNGAEDFDLWNRLAPFGEFLFIPQVLLRYRIHKKSITSVNSGYKQFQIYSRIILENFARYHIKITKEIAEELAIISGGTSVNPLTFRYRHLPNCLLLLIQNLSNKFIQLTSVSSKELLPVQSKQLIQWARCLLHISKIYAGKLLYRGFSLHKKIALTRLFYLASFALILPKYSLLWINQKRNRRLISD
jgi:glycosyltransferase involved in cell wall biosynthesis